MLSEFKCSTTRSSNQDDWKTTTFKQEEAPVAQTHREQVIARALELWSIEVLTKDGINQEKEKQ